MINKLSIRNFKCLRDVQVDLERFTVFVGPNASGKSSILQALHFLCALFHMNHPQNSDAELLQSLSRGATKPIELAVEIGDNAFRYCTRSPVALNGGLPNGNVGSRDIAANLATTDWRSWETEFPGPEEGTLPSSVLLRLEATKLVQPEPSSDATRMASDGTGLHLALANMALNDPDSWQDLQRDLRQIIPTIRRLRHTNAPQMHQPAALLFDTIGADSVPADQVSEGTLLVLGLLAALHSQDRRSLILLDDLDRGLHPKAQKELISLLRGLLDTNPDLQIVATTHSPYMLDCMEVNEVRMTFLKEDGATVCAPLTSHPDFPKWKDEMTPGEMWSMFGEKWVVQEEVPA